MINLPVDFYKKVEEDGYLKHILYGDSVGENMKSIFWIENLNKDGHGSITTNFGMNFKTIWKELLDYWFKPVIIGEKEYIFFDNINIKDLNPYYLSKNIVSFNIYTVAYNNIKKEICKCKINYIMRHKIKKETVRLYTKYTHLDVTKDHSLLNYDINSKELNIYSVNDIKYLPRCNIDVFDLVYYEETNKDKQIELDEILYKKEINYNGYVYDLEVPECHNFLANGYFVHNTDSIFICLPIPKAKDLSTEDMWKIVEFHANEINKLVNDYYNNTILKKCNIDSKHNYTWFKTELVMESMLFLDIKKVYGYKIILKDGKVNIEFDYKGFPMKRADYSKFTKDLLTKIIEEIILNADVPIKEKYKLVIETVNQFKLKFDEDIRNHTYDYIGIPKKWSKVEVVVNGMKLYNSIIGKNIFSIGSSGKLIYVILKNKNLLKDKIDVERTKAICVPYTYDNLLLQKVMIDYQIEINVDKQWETIYNKTCQRIINLSKTLFSSGIF